MPLLGVRSGPLLGEQHDQATAGIPRFLQGLVLLYFGKEVSASQPRELGVKKELLYKVYI